MSTILNKLKDNNEYYHGVGKQYLSNSDIGALLNNPKLFGISREDDINLAKGRLFHEMLLEPDKVNDFPVIDVSSRNTKKYKEALTDDIPFMLLTKDVNEVNGYVDAVNGNFDFWSLISGSEHEVPAIGEFFGVQWKGKADIVTDTDIYDLKTTRSIKEFRYSARRYNYDSQAYIYQQLFDKPMTFLVVCKETLQTGSFNCSDEFIAGGEEKVKRAVEVYNRFFGPDSDEDINSYYITDTL
mgnify:FL=1|tara:strand:- start:2425 stop:3147 length:723 start_codon:yes stop_codon:yes gene_type:complete